MSQDSHLIRFDSYDGYRAAFANVLKKAKRRIWICEYSLKESGLDSKVLHDVLWAFFTQPSPGAVRILVHDSDFLVSHCPRLMLLREHFAHLLDIRTLSDAPDGLQQGFVLVDADDYLLRRHVDWPKGEYGVGGRESAILELAFDQLWALSSSPDNMHRLYL